MTRRKFLSAMSAAPFCLAGNLSGATALQISKEASGSTRWYRGQMHMHSYWSDGNAFPEQAVAMYVEAGFNFLALTDHNVFASNPAAWREVAESVQYGKKVPRKRYEEYLAEFPGEVDSKVEEGITKVRLKTYAEVKARFDAAGDFLVLPGMELTQRTQGHEVHMNYLNIPATLPIAVPAGFTVSQLIGHNAVLAAATGIPPHHYTLTLNHPCWVFCDVLPQNLIDRPEIRFFEVCNGGSSYDLPAGAENYGCEKLWDAVNAFRCLQRKPLLFGLGTDDAHNYQPPAMNFADGFGSAWVEVRSPELSPEAIMSSMHAGEFYATCGVLLEDMTFTPADKTLRVKVQAEADVTYQICFIATKRDFNQTVTYVDSPAAGNKPARVIPVYSDDIGTTVKTVNGLEGAYQMAEDDLYVRARVESSLPAKYVRNFYPLVKTAWTQPYTAELDEAGLVPATEASSDESVPLNTQINDTSQGAPGAELSLTGYLAARSEIGQLNTLSQYRSIMLLQ